MKKLVVIVAAFIALLSSNVQAQVYKFGHINSADLVQMMPGLKDADTQLETYQKSLEDQMKTMINDYQTMVADYQAKEKLMTDAVREVKQKEIGNKEKLIQEFQQTAQEKVGAKREELYSPILKRAEQAIKDVAKEKGYSYVFDTSNGQILYAQESDDMMSLVKTKLGISAATMPINGSPMNPIPPSGNK